jgi:Zn finger protein HypA/HybF involved in hydrogenase expression
LPRAESPTRFTHLDSQSATSTCAIRAAPSRKVNIVMHEVALVSAAVAQAVEAAQRAGARRVERMTFALAPGGHVSQETVEVLVSVLSRGTIVEGAELAFESTAMSSDLALVSIDVESAAETMATAPDGD